MGDANQAGCGVVIRERHLEKFCSIALMRCLFLRTKLGHAFLVTARSRWFSSSCLFQQYRFCVSARNSYETLGVPGTACSAQRKLLGRLALHGKQQSYITAQALTTRFDFGVTREQSYTGLACPLIYLRPVVRAELFFPRAELCPILPFCRGVFYVQGFAIFPLPRAKIPQVR